LQLEPDTSLAWGGAQQDAKAYTPIDLIADLPMPLVLHITIVTETDLEGLKALDASLEEICASLGSTVHPRNYQSDGAGLFSYKPLLHSPTGPYKSAPPSSCLPFFYSLFLCIQQL
jgi:hypothetical protein